MTLAEVWRDALRRANALDPDRIARCIVQTADNGLRATSYDRDGSRTSNSPCEDPERCPDGPAAHSHPVTSDPTGNAAMRRKGDDGTADLRTLDRASQRFVEQGTVVLDFVAGHRPSTWAGVVRANAELMPGSVQAGLDVDDERVLPFAIAEVGRAVDIVEAIAKANLPREPSEDERHWTDGLADEACCAWHLAVEPRGRYRRLRAGGTNVCAECHQIIEWAGAKPPVWFMEALVERDSKPVNYRRALSRWAEELGLLAG